jgi:hypothetical protein
MPDRDGLPAPEGAPNGDGSRLRGRRIVATIRQRAASWGVVLNRLCKIILIVVDMPVRIDAVSSRLAFRNLGGPKASLLCPPVTQGNSCDEYGFSQLF